MTASASLRLPAVAAIASLTLLGFLVATQTSMLGAVNTSTKTINTKSSVASSVQSAVSSQASSAQSSVAAKLKAKGFPPEMFSASAYSEASVASSKSSSIAAKAAIASSLAAEKKAQDAKKATANSSKGR